jgi:hypothetical protein
MRTQSNTGGEAELLLAHRSSDTLDLKPLYLGDKEYQRLMSKLKKKTNAESSS